MTPSGEYELYCRPVLAALGEEIEGDSRTLAEVIVGWVGSESKLEAEFVQNGEGS